MKKIILNNNSICYQVKYVISKKKYAIYLINFVNYKYLEFLKNHAKHRLCNIGPQYNSVGIIRYRENNKFHNLYGPAHINKADNSELYYINDIHYKEDQFNNYLSIYNNLSYKRTY